MQSSLGVKNTYTTIWTGAYLRTTSGTSTATETLKIVHNLAGSSLPPPKEFSASNYYSSRKFLFNYHCQKTDTDKRESHREGERRWGVRGKGGKRARILRYIPCATFSRASVSSCPKQNEGQSSPIPWEKAEPIWGAASQTAWLSSPSGCCAKADWIYSFSPPPPAVPASPTAAPPPSPHRRQWQQQISQTSNFVSRLQTFCCERARFVAFFFLRRLQRPKPNG